MHLDILQSDSNGNGYILHNDSEALLIEAGCHLSLVKKALKFNIKKIVGALITHEHGDHAKYASEYIKQAGIDLYSSAGTFAALKLQSHRTRQIKAGAFYTIGGFKILPFDIKHDAAEPLGFLINHKETGTILFLTDTMYSPYTFTGLNNVIVEANYSTEILAQRMEQAEIPLFVKNRIIKAHMSFENTLSLLAANDLKQVNNIVLIHLSHKHSDENMYREQTEQQTGKAVTIAKPGVSIPFNKTPF